MTRISLISAMATNRVIGNGNTIPWHISEDFKYFKRVTMGKPMMMGRKTFESLPGLLPGRPHLIVSRSGFKAEGAESFSSLEEAIEHAKTLNDEEIFIIGGGQIYEQSLPLANRIYLTEIHESYDGDAFFPEFDNSEWSETSRDPQDGEPAYDFVVYDKI